MIESDIERIVQVIKQQAELFLLNAREFYPFGTYINMNDKIVPVGAYPGGEHPASADVIDLLERGYNKKIQNNECKIGAIALDIFINQNGEKYDGIEIRFFEPGKDIYSQVWKYLIKDGYVEFVKFDD